MVSMIPHRRSRGSPPRVRGKVLFKTLGEGTFGITPAYAGKRHCPRSRPGRIRDHPRVCGEKAVTGEGQETWKGSPPRMRGKAAVAALKGHAAGITPAYAGKSIHALLCVPASYGSPPRMRGKVSLVSLVLSMLGITPAYAGKSGPAEPAPTAFRDHPRVCGEKFTVNTVDLDLIGSPPRMRGKACAASGRACAAGITPAYAGKRYKVLPDTCGTGDYPRVCGEKYDAPP